MATWNYSKGTMEALHAQLHSFLLQEGESSRMEICKALKWSSPKFQKILGTRPDWLVVTNVRKTPKGRSIYLYNCQGEHILGNCENCGNRLHSHTTRCTCFRSGRLEPAFTEAVDIGPTSAKPGSEDKLAVLAARYESGAGLWDDQDSRVCVSRIEPEYEDWDDD